MRIFSIAFLLVVLTVSTVLSQTVVIPKTGTCPGPCGVENDHCDERDECQNNEDCDEQSTGCTGVCPRVCSSSD